MESSVIKNITLVLQFIHENLLFNVCLIILMYSGIYTLVKYLWQKNKKRMTKQAKLAFELLYYICKNDNISSMKMIKKHPECINTIVDPDGYTPFLVACMHGNTQLAKLMLDNSADIHKKSKNGETPFYLATYYHVKNPNELNASCLHLLYHNGGKDDINIPTKRGYTPLQLAAIFGLSNLVRWLLSKGANPAVTPHPYILAKSEGFQKTASVFVDWEKSSLIPALEENFLTDIEK